MVLSKHMLRFQDLIHCWSSINLISGKELGRSGRPRESSGQSSRWIKKDTKKLLDVDFIKHIQHPTWLANSVPLKKKNGQIH